MDILLAIGHVLALVASLFCAGLAIFMAYEDIQDIVKNLAGAWKHYSNDREWKDPQVASQMQNLRYHMSRLPTHINESFWALVGLWISIIVMYDTINYLAPLIPIIKFSWSLV